MLNSSQQLQEEISFVEKLALHINMARNQKSDFINPVKAYPFTQAKVMEYSKDFLAVLSPAGVCQGITFMHAILHKQNPNFQASTFVEVISQAKEVSGSLSKQELLENIMMAQSSLFTWEASISFDNSTNIENMITPPLKGAKYFAFGLLGEETGGHIMSLWQDLRGWNIFDTNHGEILGLTSSEVIYCIDRIIKSYAEDGLIFNSFYLDDIDKYEKFLFDANAVQVGFTKLHKAILHEDTELVKFLISKGANVDTIDEHGQSPVLWASGKHSPEIIRVLLSKGADINLADEDGVTPLMVAIDESKSAATHRLLETIEILVESGANVNSVATCETTVLMVAFAAQNTAIINFLLEKGALISQVYNNEGFLAWMFYHGNTDITNILLGHYEENLSSHPF